MKTLLPILVALTGLFAGGCALWGIFVLGSLTTAYGAAMLAYWILPIAGLGIAYLCLRYFTKRRRK